MKIRLFIQGKYKPGDYILLSSEHTHYLKTVLRKDTGTTIFIFNEDEKEFECELYCKKKSTEVKVLSLLTTNVNTIKVKINLVFAWVKKEAASDILQKCTQIGVNGFYPIETSYSERNAKLTKERAEKIIIEACEQSQRNNIPFFNSTLSLQHFLQIYNNKTFFFCDENGRFENPSFLPPVNSDEVFIIVGPEGGFTPTERILLTSQSNSYPISLGQYILKAETACACATFLLSTKLNTSI